MTDYANEETTQLAKRLPELTAFDGDHEIGELMQRAFGEPQLFLSPKNPVALTNTLLACLLRERLRALEEAMERIEIQAEVAQAAQQRWQALMRAGAKIVFVNDAGDLAEVPAEIVTLMGDHKAIDVTVIDRGAEIAFLQGERQVAIIPKTLLVSLPRILQRGLWTRPKSSSAHSQSHPSRGTPSSSKPRRSISKPSRSDSPAKGAGNGQH